MAAPDVPLAVWGSFPFDCSAASLIIVLADGVHVDVAMGYHLSGWLVRACHGCRPSQGYHELGVLGALDVHSNGPIVCPLKFTCINVLCILVNGYLT